MTAPEPLPEKADGPPDWLPSVDDERSLRRLWWVLGAVLAAGVLAFLIRGADRPADPSVESSDRTALPGFGEVSVEITEPGGSVLERCLLLAATPEQRARGLMTVTDPSLGGYDGMLFRFDADSTGAFYMRNTPMPLSIAYIDAAGAIVSTTDMQPCADMEGCPTYPATGPYRYALEVPQGQLATVGMVEGARLSVGEESCPPG